MSVMKLSMASVLAWSLTVSPLAFSREESSPVNNTFPQPSWCIKAKSAVEKMVCQDSGLSASAITLDTQWDSYKSLHTAAEIKSMRQYLRDWNKNTFQKCDSVPCVEAAYEKALYKQSSNEHLNATTEPAPAPVEQRKSTEKLLSVPSDPGATFYVLDKAKNGVESVIITKRIGSSGTGYSSRLYNCQDSTVKYLGSGSTFQEMEQSSPDPSMSPIVAGSIAYYVGVEACK